MNRRFRLIAAIGTSVLLVAFMGFIVLRGAEVQAAVLQADELVTRHELATKQKVQVDGIAVGPVKGTIGKKISFFVADRDGKNKTKVEYEGSVPDVFKVGRNVILMGKLEIRDGERVFVGEPNTLVTKCPSKFESE